MKVALIKMALATVAVMTSMASAQFQMFNHPIVQDHELEWYKNWLTCSICKGWVSTLKDEITEVQYLKMAQGAGWFACIFSEKGDVCKNVVEQTVLNFTSQAFDLMLSQDLVCGYYFHLCGSTQGEIFFDQLTVESYRNNVLAVAGAPASVADNNALDAKYAALPGTPGTTFRILWFSDIELDTAYSVGSAKTCSDAACCHADTKAANDADKAGPYGSQSCYLNADGLNKMLQEINALNNTADFTLRSIFFGGSTQANIPEHLSSTTLTQTQSGLLQFLRAYNPFVGIYYAIGENDIMPAHLLSMTDTRNPQLSSIDAAFNPGRDFTDSSNMVLSTTERTLFTQKGYSMTEQVVVDTDVDSRTNLAQGSIPGTALIAIFLNMQACDNRNFALMQEKDDPAGQLAWLQTQLKTAEDNAKKVWIFGNRSPSSRRCNNKWGRRYNAIIERFQDVVLMQNFGFDEEETFSLQFSDKKPNQPFGVIMQGGKSTAFQQNPKFRIIEIDSSTFLPLASTLYEYRLDKLEADERATGLIEAIHTYPTSYTGMTDFSPSQFKALADQLKTDEALAIRYLNAVAKNQAAHPVTSCDTTCREDLYCRLVNASQQEAMKCRGLGFLDPVYGLDYALSQIQNPWVEQKTKA